MPTSPPNTSLPPLNPRGQVKTPYYAVIFTSLRTPEASSSSYSKTADRMEELARLYPGFIAIESVSNRLQGITVSYWRDLETIANWKKDLEHLEAQRRGRDEWYKGYIVRVVKVEREYAFGGMQLPVRETGDQGTREKKAKL